METLNIEEKKKKNNNVKRRGYEIFIYSYTLQQGVKKHNFWTKHNSGVSPMTQTHKEVYNN